MKGNKLNANIKKLIVFQMNNISTMKGRRNNTNNFWMQYILKKILNFS